MKIFINLFLIIFCGLFKAQAVIEQVDDSDLVHLMTAEDNVIVLFTKNDCILCDELEHVLDNIQNELKHSIGAVVVKAHNSHMVSLYDPSKEPALIYFRHGTPLLYYGGSDGEEILQVFNENKEPVVKELSDGNFEHLTQSATGATTGDWFVFFYSVDCIFCSRLHATWEAVGAHLKHRLNLARIDRLGAGIATAKRFAITKSPEFIFLRQGKIYRYKHKEYTASKLIEFVKNGYVKQSYAESVPPEGRSLNSYITDILELATHSSQFVLILSALALIIIIVLKCAFSKKATTEGKNKAKKSK